MTGNEWIYWGYDDQLLRQNKLLDSETHHPRTKELIQAYHAHLLTNGIKQARIAKLTWGLRKVSLTVEKPLDAVTKADMERVLTKILTEKHPRTGKPLKETTQRDYKRCVKQFYRWLADQDGPLPDTLPKLCDYLRKSVKTPDPKRNHDPGNCITDEDVSAVLDKGCSDHMERAFISTLFETGARIGEHLALRIADIQDEENDLWTLRLNGKTGERVVPIIQSIPFLSRWLAFHPNRTDPDAPLWFITHNVRYGRPLRYTGARRLIDRCFLRAGMNKRHNPHWWRHSRATIDARDTQYTDSVLCQKMGHGPKVAARYRHISGQDVKDAARRSAGIRIPEDDKKRPLLPQQCKLCLDINPHNAKYCGGCGKALNSGVILQEREYLQKAFELFSEVMGDSNLRQQFEDYKQQQRKFNVGTGSN